MSNQGGNPSFLQGPSYDTKIRVSSSDSFDEIVEKTLNEIRELLIVKGKEYRRNGNPYHNFEVGAVKTGLIREKVLDGFLLKHEISISDITNDLDKGVLPSKEAINEKFNDIFVYNLLKKAMILDRINNQK